MSKKTIMAAIIISSLLISQLIGIQLIREAEAGPPIYTTSPNTDPPILSVQSPNNITYYTNDILLNIAVAYPSSWDYNKSIIEVSYTLDGQNCPLWASSFGNEGANYTFPAIKELSTFLTGLANGEHTLKINVNGKYFPSGNPLPWYGLDTSQTMIFTINVPQSTTPSQSPYVTISPTPSQSPSPTPSIYPTLSPTLEPIQSATPTPSLGVLYGIDPLPLILGIVAVVIVAIVGLAVYFTKRRKMKTAN